MPAPKKSPTKKAADWHTWIAFEMKTPAMPADAPPELVEEIQNQSERHETFAKVLKRLDTASGAKPKKK